MAKAAKERLEKLFDEGLDWDRYYADESIVDKFAAELESLERRAEVWDALEAHTQLVNEGTDDVAISAATERLNKAIVNARSGGKNG